MKARTKAALAFLISLCAPALFGDDHPQPPPEELDFRLRPEAWAMKHFGGVMLFSGFGPAETMEPGSLSLALEVGHIPTLSRKERRIGFDGRKVEDLNKAPMLIRPRITIGMPGRFSLTGSYVPPIKVFDVETELIAVSLNRPLIETEALTIGIRGFAQYGNVHGSITCPDDKWQRADYQEFGCDEPSSDTVRTRIYGVELGASYRISRLRDLTPYATVSYQHMNLEFEVDAITHGTRDNRRLITDGETWAAGLGATLPLTERINLSAGVVYMPNSVRRPNRDRRNEPMINTRLQLSYSL
ncbi:MAG: hypothetical protein WD490_09685 [Opitutales bacterium]